MRRSLWFWCVMFLFTPLITANATVLTFEFSGNITQVPLDDLFGDIAFGDGIEGSFTFDTAAADLAVADTTTGIYQFGAPFGMDVTVGTHKFSTSGLLNISILNSFVDQYAVLALDGASGLTLELFLQDNTGSVFTNDLLPLAAPQLSGFGQRDFHLDAILGNGETQFDGQLTSLSELTAPEPGPGPLFAVSMVLLALGRNSMNKRSGKCFY